MVVVSPENLKASLGALILGGFVATGLSGVAGMQTALYFRLFSKDKLMTKLHVLTVFLLDFLHTTMVITACYTYFVDHFGEQDVTDQAFWAVGISIALTAGLTLIVHLFFAFRLYKLSKGNTWITGVVVTLALLRVGAAMVTTVKLIHIGSFSEFGQQFDWAFTLGLVLSSVVDFLITGGLCYYLRKNRTGAGEFDHVLDSVTLYTVENGLLTSVTTVVSLIFWLARPHVLIYLGLHFAISKLYANSFLASMNARQMLRAQSQPQSGSGHRLPVLFSNGGRLTGDQVTAVQITVDKTVEYGDTPFGDSTDYKQPAGIYLAGV